MDASTRTLPPEAVRNMRQAVAAQQRGDLARAEAAYRALIREFPDFPEAWHYYGLLLHQRGKGREALPYLRRAQALKSEDPGFLLNFGRILLELGEFRPSAACLERALGLAPRNPVALELHAQALLALERGGEAVRNLENFLAGGPGNWRLWLLLGDCREQGGDREGALSAFAEAARLAPAAELAPSLHRAEAAMRAGDSALAASEFEAVVARDPSNALAHLGLANLASHAGDFARAASRARDALRCDPALYPAWALLAADPGIAAEEQFGRSLENVAADAGSTPDAWPLYFALGTVREKRGDFDGAFAAYRRGNEIQGRGRRYSAEAQEAYVRDIVGSLGSDFAARAPRVGVDSGRAIFICGMPRSGTTLVEAILASHPEVAAGGEMRHIHDRLRRELGIRGLAKTGSWLRGLPDGELRSIANEWRAALRSAGGPARVTDKMPSNYYFLGLIHACFPDASIVHVRRDPLDNAVSCFTTSFQEGNAFSNSLEGIGHYYRLHDELIEHWRRILGPERIVQVAYESLVRDPEPQIRRLVEAVGLPWHPACLDFHRQQHSVRTASLYQVRRPLYGSSIGRWRRFERHLGPLKEALQRPLPL